MECTIICFVIILCIILYIIYRSSLASAARQNQINAEIRNLKSQITKEKENAFSSLKDYFMHEDGNIYRIQRNFIDCIAKMTSINDNLIRLSKKDDMNAEINSTKSTAKKIDQFINYVNSLPPCFMMDVDNYGKINKSFWDKIQSLERNPFNEVQIDYEEILDNRTILGDIIQRIWFYATEKPYSAKDFKNATHCFYRIYDYLHLDACIAELYALNQVGGESALAPRIREVLKEKWNESSLTQIASSMMWMKAYQAENIVLQSMLSSGMQMSSKTQERLHALSIGGGKTLHGFEVEIDKDIPYFDISALAWKDVDYNGLFDNLSFKDEKLNYSLAIRDEDKELIIAKGINVPSSEKILEKINESFKEEYGDDVLIKFSKCIALSGSGEEELDGFIAVPNECSYMGVLMHIARIGKKLNIKFYTLFIPTENEVSVQKQKALSLFNKLSPTVSMWEGSLMHTMLITLQQMLNESNEVRLDVDQELDKSDSSKEEPIL